MLALAACCLIFFGHANARADQLPKAEFQWRPAPQNRPFNGTIKLEVDATDAEHHIFAVRESIPVQTFGDTVLLYPEWETASHAPTASAIGFAGLTVMIDGRHVPWQRDPIDAHAFRISVPTGAQLITLAFDFLAPRGGALLRSNMVDVQWQRLLVYPAGWFAKSISVQATLTLAAGLRAFTALALQSSQGNSITFRTDTLDRLIDAPVYAARYWRTVALTEASTTPITLDVVADDAKDIAPSPPALQQLRELVTQTVTLFGPPPFRHYDAILSLSDKLSPGGGIEHLEEGENNLPADYFTDMPHQLNNRDLIAHELVHCWNGRFRIPSGMATPDYNSPSNDSLLWVYEGQTEFWGRILAARSGLRNKRETLDKLALDAAVVANRPGRAWKTLEDSSYDPTYMAGHPVGWRDWQRREDYYPEGVLLWLDVDARIRELTGERAGLDDFARRFFATNGNGIATSYDFQELCAALAAIAPEDWSQFLLRQLRTHDTTQAMAGLARSGWRLVYDTTPSETFRQDEGGAINLDYSIGLQVDEHGVVRSVVWHGPAFTAGLDVGDHILSVSGKPFSAETLEAAVSEAAKSPIVLSLDGDGKLRDVRIAYSGTLRYPHLERIPGKPDRLSALLVPR